MPSAPGPRSVRERHLAGSPQAVLPSALRAARCTSCRRVRASLERRSACAGADGAEPPFALLGRAATSWSVNRRGKRLRVLWVCGAVRPCVGNVCDAHTPRLSQFCTAAKYTHGCSAPSATSSAPRPPASRMLRSAARGLVRAASTLRNPAAAASARAQLSPPLAAHVLHRAERCATPAGSRQLSDDALGGGEPPDVGAQWLSEASLQSIVKVFTVHSSPNYYMPWQNKPQRESTGAFAAAGSARLQGSLAPAATAFGSVLPPLLVRLACLFRRPDLAAAPCVNATRRLGRHRGSARPSWRPRHPHQRALRR